MGLGTLVRFLFRVFRNSGQSGPVCQSEVTSWCPIRFWGVDVYLCDDWEVVSFYWAGCILRVAFDDGVHDGFRAEDIVDSGKVTCIVSAKCRCEWWEHHFHIMPA